LVEVVLPFKRSFHGIQFGVLGLVLLAAGLQSCSGNSVNITQRPVTVPPANIAGTVVQHAMVVLPPGTSLVPNTLTVKNALGVTTPHSDGSFSVTQFAGGPQFAFVTNPEGDAVLAGFIGPNDTTIDVESTIKVFIYWSAGFFTLPSPYREETVDAVASQPGFQTVVDAWTADLQSSDNPFLHAMGRANVVMAIQSFTQSLYSSTAAQSKLTHILREAGARRPGDVSVSPATARSGITTVNDPSGVHFVNTYRRLAQAFFDEDSYVNASGTRVSDSVPDAVPAVEIPAVSGINGVSGGPIEVGLSLLSGSTSYTPVTTGTVTLPQVAGAQSTRYNVTIVGAGAANPTVTLSPEQSAAQQSIVVEQLGEDYLVPLVASVAIPINSAAIDNYLAGGGNAQLASIASQVETIAPQLYPVADSGQVGDALVLGMNALAADQPLQTQLLQLVGDLISSTAGSAAAQAFQDGYSPLYALNVLSAVVISNDTAVASANIAASDQADVFVVDVGSPSPSPSPSASASPSASPAAPNLYIAEIATPALTVTASTANGNVAPSRTIAGSNTAISQDYGVAVDASGNSYVSDLRNPVITVYGPTANGNVAPIRTITGSNTGLSAPLGLAIDASGELLVANFSSQTVEVFAGGANGNATPVRTIAGSNTGLTQPYGITLDASGKLYVVNNGSQFGGTDSVTVYAAGASGNVAPLQTISGSNTGMTGGAVFDAVDSSGHIYVASTHANAVTVYAAGATGNVAPIAKITGASSTLSTPTGIAVDAAGTIYVDNDGTNSITVFAPGANGNVAPIRTIAGGSTGINGPQQMLLAR
jgi:sugar lactone lactonase YvrE